MTNKEIFEKLEAEIERLENYENESVTSSDTRFGWIHGKTFALTSIRVLLDSMQKEPKKCIYSKDNHTDDDRKVLCEGCEEECKMGIKSKHATGKLKECIDNITDESLAKARKQLQEELVNGGLDLGCGVIWKDEKSVSDDLEQAIDTYLAAYFGGEKEKQDWPFLKKMAMYFVAWQKQKDSIPVSEDLEQAAFDNAQKNYKEGFRGAAMQAFNEGVLWQKQQMMAKAVDGEVGYWNLHGLSCNVKLPHNVEEGDKVKLIIIKED